MSGFLPRVRHPRFALFLAAFLLGALILVPTLGLLYGAVSAFDLAALIFAASCIPLWREDGLEEIRARAARDDGGRLLLLLTSFVILITVLIALTLLVHGKSGPVVVDFVLVAGTLILAWIFGNLVYAFHYAHLYYDEEQKPALDFPGDEPPLFTDFCYFSFVLGMTFQVSDVQILTRDLRREAMVHGLFAFFFNIGVLALSINVLAGVL